MKEKVWFSNRFLPLIILACGGHHEIVNLPDKIIRQKMRIHRLLLLVSLLILTNGSKAQQNDPTRADSLRGSNRIERSCYDVREYDLFVKVDTSNKSISGNNRISFDVLTAFQVMQIDLFSNMSISKITLDGSELKYKREFNAVFVDVGKRLNAGDYKSIVVHYSGKPLIAKNPPWDGGFSWAKDSKGLPWIGVSCEGIGASLWWPCKDDLSDEPNSMNIHCNVPSNLHCVANGKEKTPNILNDGTTTFNWHVSYPINNYNVSINVANYAHWHDVYTANDGDTLSLDYYVLKENEAKSRIHFAQVKPMLNCYEKYLGKYPFWEDGYALVETSYLGMEHQGAIAYGNRYKQGYAGMDRSGQKLPFDYIIIHESGHEWWGNSVSCRDLADLWIHESFCTYSEAIYVECQYGYDTAMKYVNALKTSVENVQPMIGTYGINREGHSDMYVKGMLFLNTLRHVVNDDEIWWPMIKNMCDTTFQMKGADYSEVVAFFNEKTKQDLSPLFAQYVKHSSIPRFTYKLRSKKNSMRLKYKWNAEVKNFNMPLDVMVGAKKIRIYPTLKWQKIKLANAIEPFSVNTAEFYVNLKPD
jgi:aminopeptidase N